MKTREQIEGYMEEMRSLNQSWDDWDDGHISALEWVLRD
jgi:hypothetical protein